MRLAKLRRNFDQKAIVLVLFLVIFCVFSAVIPGFLTKSNLILLTQNVSVLGILGIGMSIVIIGRGIDLSIASTMALSVGVMLYLNAMGLNIYLALLAGAAIAAVIGVINGWLVAYAEIPSLFATLAMSACIYGFGRYFLIDTDMIYTTSAVGALVWLGSGQLFGIPAPVLTFGVVAAVVGLFLWQTKIGLFLYAVGDNPATSRITGLPVRQMIVLSYVLCAVIAALAGTVQAMAVGGINTRLSDSLIVYDVILVAVLGGVSLSGARGGVTNVLAGTLLIGTCLNGMTILNMQFTTQSALKSIVLLAAIVIDALINPRNEHIARQGDI